MIISNNWLHDYVDHDLEIDTLSEMLTMSGLEVEGVNAIGSSLEGVVVARVLDKKQHPNADRLSICLVDSGGDEPVQIVCGASNVATGQNVALATVGTTLQLPDREDPERRVAIKIKKSKLRGEQSLGMICAEDELGLSTDHTGIMVLDDNAAIGTPLSDYLAERDVPSGDHAIDIAITPNRPDAVCHLGVARDVAAVTGLPLSAPEVDMTPFEDVTTDTFGVSIEAPNGCHRYVGILVREISIGPSPQWLQHRLNAVGLRPRNNIVDITNYVMYEMGQPLHAFDFDQLGGPEIIVRQTKDETTFVTLDGKERALPPGTLMIADTNGDVAIAGIMGGENSEVTDRTVNVLIESAYFDPSSIRKTSKTLQLQTDASYRFERGIDPTMQARAAARAAHLMTELAGGTADDGMVDVRTKAFHRSTTTLRPSRVQAILGVSVPLPKIIELLTAIGFTAKQDSEDLLHIDIPAFRPDVEREIDVIEEVARLYGYQNIPEPARSNVPNHTGRVAPDRVLREKARDLLSGIGYREICTNSMLRRETAERFFDTILPGARFGGTAVETMNPISQEMAALRPSLLPGALTVAAYNSNRGADSIRVFEFGTVHAHVDTPHSVVGNYTERESLLIFLAGKMVIKAWHNAERPSDVYDLKGLIESLSSAFQLPDLKLVPSYEPTDVTRFHLDITAAGEQVGIIAEVSPALTESFDLNLPAFFVELDWTTVATLSAGGLKRTFEPFSRQPGADRDLAVTIERTQAVGPVLETIRKAGKPLLSDVRLFDVYEGDQIGPSVKSVAFAVRFSGSKTLREAEIDRAMKSIVSALESEHSAQLRS